MIKIKFFNIDSYGLVFIKFITAFAVNYVLTSAIWEVASTQATNNLGIFLVFRTLPMCLSIFAFLFFKDKLLKVKSLKLILLFFFLVFVVSFILLNILPHHVFIILTALFFFLGIISSILNILLMSFIGVIIDKKDLLKLNSALVLATSMASILAPPFSGISYKSEGIFFVLGVGVLCSLPVLAYCLYTPKENPLLQVTQGSQVITEKFIHRVSQYKKILLLVSIFFLINIFISPSQIFIPLYVKILYGKNIVNFVILEIGLSIGIILGSISHKYIVIPRGMLSNVSSFICISSLSYVIFTFSKFMWTDFLALLIMGFSDARVSVYLMRFIQSSVKRNDLTLIMSIFYFSSGISVPLGVMLITFLLPHFNTMLLAQISSLIALSFSSYLFFYRKS